MGVAVESEGAVDRCGPGHVQATLSPMGTEDGQGRRRGYELKYTAKFRKPPPSLPPPELFSLYDEEPGGRRPPCLGEPPRSQERVQRYTVAQLADVAPMVQILDVPVPLMVDQLVDVFKHIDISVPEEVIEVHKIPCPSLPLRAAQMAEQLVEVPVLESVILARGRDARGMVPGCGADGGPLVDGAHEPHPVDFPRGRHRQPRAVFNFWRRLTCCAYGLQLWTSL